ncbi:MAG: hypothetical protein HYX69_04725 [Planctomycetia bacterium]|nr:hypothetical protein [Planctomycetia bacterium]
MARSIGLAWILALGFTGLAAADGLLGSTSYYDEAAAAGEVAAGDPSAQVTSPRDDGGCESCGGLCDSCRGCDQDCCDSWGRCGRFLGLLPSDHCFDRFISPLSNPFFFEDPRALTEIRGIFFDNSLPNTIDGGDVQFWGAQVRGRVTDRLSVIAPRLGYFQVNQGVGGAPSGFLSAPVGVKGTLLRDVDNQFLLSGGITYFIPGSISALPTFGDGDFHFFLTGGKQIFGRGHWLSGTGFRIPVNSNWGTQMWYWSNQWDYELPGHLYPLFGVNWFHWMRSSTGPLNTGGITALDILNLPSQGVAGSNVVSAVVGGRWKPNGHVEIGSGFEFPLTDNRDILRNRVYADLILRY